MLVYRSFVVGMLGAIALLIASLPGELAKREQEPAAVIHVSASAITASPHPWDTLADLLALSSGARRVVFVVEP